MKLTQKHFEFLQSVLRNLPVIPINDELHKVVVEHFAEALSKTNPKFKKDLFVASSGVRD